LLILCICCAWYNPRPCRGSLARNRLGGSAINSFERFLFVCASYHSSPHLAAKPAIWPRLLSSLCTGSHKAWMPAPRPGRREAIGSRQTDSEWNGPGQNRWRPNCSRRFCAETGPRSHLCC